MSRARIVTAALVAWFSVVAGPPASAQVITKTTPGETVAAPEPAAAAEPEGVSPAEMIEIFQAVESWVRAGEAPEADPAAAPFNTPAFSHPSFGASVVIRLDGRIVGRGVRISPDARVGFPREAAAEAVRVASKELEDAGPDAPITVSLEIAGQLIPMPIGKDEELAMRMSPGLDGLAMRRGSQTTAWFPSQMLERNALPSAVLGPLVTLLGGPTADKLKPADELEGEGYTIYRFRTMQLATPLPGLGPVFLHRGGRVVSDGEVNRDGLLGFAAGLVTHLGGMVWPGVEPYGLSGSLDPVSGSRAASAADPVVQGTAAMALLRAASLTGLDPATAERSRALGETLLRDLATAVGGETEPWSAPGPAAAALVGLAELSPDRLEMDEQLVSLRDRCLKTLRDAFDPRTGYTGADGSVNALVALALVRDAQVFGGDPETASASVNAVYRDTPPGMLVAQMPWLGWASLGLADLRGGEIGAASRLRAMRELVWKHQLRSTDLDFDDRDLAGGIVFTSGTTPLPTWQSVRPVAFLATMLSSPELTTGSLSEGEWPGELVRVLDSLRFFRQLSAGTEEGHLYRRPGLARWGVRSSLWDQSMPTEASVLALMAVSETLDALQSRASE